jgi:hypothetical protein
MCVGPFQTTALSRCSTTGCIRVVRPHKTGSILKSASPFRKRQKRPEDLGIVQGQSTVTSIRSYWNGVTVANSVSSVNGENMARHRRLYLATSFICTFCCVALCLSVIASDPEVDVIVNPSNNIASLSPGDLHRIFLGEKGTWPNGKHIFLIMPAPGSAERASILKNVYKMSESDYSKYFLQASFTGAVSAPPRDAASSAQVKQLVIENPGAIGYISESEADSSVKVLMKVP